MDPKELPLVWYRNAPEQQGFSMEIDSITPGVKDPFDLTGYTFAMQVRLYPGAAGDPILDLGMAAEGAPGFYINSEADGEFTLTPPPAGTLEALAPLPAATDDITKGKVVLSYDILLISGGIPEPFLKGSLTLYSGVTV